MSLTTGYKELPKFSVLMSVYKGDMPEYLDTAIESIVKQTLPPDEIVLVKDGALRNDLNAVVEKWKRDHPAFFLIVPLEKNVGLGLALRAGMARCSYDIIARMDADDISAPDRFEKQLIFLDENPEIDVVSTWTQQFYNNPEDVAFVRPAPTSHKEIVRLARFRSPITHAAVMYRRHAVLDVGGYDNWFGFEDYHLWVRMLLHGSKLACIPEPLYMVRRGGGLVGRRGGLKRAYMQVLLQREFLRIGFISLPRFLTNVIVRVIAAILPGKLMELLRVKLKI